MSDGRMVHLATMRSSFEAQLVAARLGAEGVLWQLQGPVGGPLPLSEVSVLVHEDDLSRAREILLLGAPEPAPASDAPDDPSGAPARGRGALWVLGAGLLAVAITRTIGMHLV